MPKVEELTSYARRLADDLDKDMSWVPTAPGNIGHWEAAEPSKAAAIEARSVAAQEFLRQYAGPDSHWAKRATSRLDEGRWETREDGARAVGDLLRAWADQVEAGITEIVGARAWAEAGVADTDIMGQVRRLLDDRKTHPGSVIALCGAALEIALRAVAEARNLTLSERPSIGAYTRLLRQEKLITAQDVKDLDQCAGLRNLAAHGQFDTLSLERAGLMEQQTNILLRKLADLHI